MTEQKKKSKILAVLTGITLLFLLLPLDALVNPVSDEDCLTCHEDPELAKYSTSIHGQAGLSCLDCHQDLKGIEDFPHAEKLEEARCAACHTQAAEEFKASIHSLATPEKQGYAVSCKDCHGTHSIKGKEEYDSQIFPLNLPRTCEKCHLEKVKTERGQEFIKQYEKSIHYQGLERAGLATSSNCSNCHGSHNIRSIKDPLSPVSRKNIVKTCGQCHIGIERDYLDGVHGKNYEKGLKDVPVCTDCHSEHDITSPQDLSSTVYATKVAGVCSRCHDDEVVAERYGLHTSRLKSYTQTFHGTASRFGEKRVANCASCHGFHAIRSSSDPKSQVHSDNLPKTCGICHKGAGEKYAQGKVHVVSQKETNIWAYYVKTFYIVIIVSIVGVFLIFISADLLHRLTSKADK